MLFKPYHATIMTFTVGTQQQKVVLKNKSTNRSSESTKFNLNTIKSKLKNYRSLVPRLNPMNKINPPQKN